MAAPAYPSICSTLTPVQTVKENPPSCYRSFSPPLLCSILSKETDRKCLLSLLDQERGGATSDKKIDGLDCRNLAIQVDRKANVIDEVFG